MQFSKILTLALFAVALTSCASSPPKWESWGAQKARGKVGRKLDIRFAEGTEKTVLDVEGGSLTANILQVVNDHGKRRIIVKVKLRNGTDEHVNFSLGDVRLKFADEEFSAQVGGFTFERRPDVLPRASKSFTWFFDIEAVADTGMHDLVVRNFTSNDSEALFPDQEFVIQIKVPGETLNFSQSTP